MKELEEGSIRKDEIISERDKYISEIEEKLKTIEDEKIAHDVIKSYDDQEENEFMYKETVSNFLKNPDGEKSLTMFLYVMHKKMKSYQSELEQGM